MNLRPYAFLLALLAWSCSAHSFRPSSPPRPGDPHGHIRFRAFASTPDEPAAIQQWSFIPVYLVTAAGRQLVGKTDAAGLITLSKDLIWSPGAIALLFCADPGFIECSALTLDTEYLRGFDEYSVQVPRFQLLD